MCGELNVLLAFFISFLHSSLFFTGCVLYQTQQHGPALAPSVQDMVSPPPPPHPFQQPEPFVAPEELEIPAEMEIVSTKA